MASTTRRTGSYSSNYRNNVSRARRASDRNVSREEYIYGNTARALRPIDDEVKSPKRVSSKSRKNIDRETSMSPAFMLFVTAAMVLTGFACMQYIRLQSDITNHVATISKMEIQLEELKAENDDYESRIKGAVGLENIKKRAMDDLGMSYASDEQIVIYESDGTDYVRQFVSLE